MTKNEYFFRILVLGFLTAIGPFSIDMYLPSYDAIAADLHTTTSQIGLSLASFFIGLAAGQLLYGPLLDRFGRKKPLYIGLSLYIIASIGCMAARSANDLIILRFVEAIGSCAAAVASVAMVRDLFPVQDNAKVFSLLMLVVGLSPLLAPMVGGLLTTYFGWQSIFATLAGITLLVLLAVIFKLPETYKPDTAISLKPLPIINNFIMVLKVPQFYTYAFAGAIAFSGLFAYVSGAPLVLIDIYHVSKNMFTVIFACMAAGFIGFSQVNSMAMRYYKSEQLLKAALTVQTISGVIFVFASVNGWLGLAGNLFFIFIFLSCLGFISSNASALTLAPFSKNAGSASALMGALQLGIGALTSFGVSKLNNHTAVPLAAIMGATSVLALGILLLGRRMIKNKVEVTEGTAVVMH
ncbi:DHA1 family bicyclomycin/chloramphenicol resistance-like MFS transporter [Mucilaginibacter gracilis]|uniref:DHA1 family bicyclomycin/chloramphenicol resistance-like MFS transporter n=1 Tax=Mucilaginibacter gracilis TaxID=423350 RepID=A0A495J7J1_9SPHI|nr:multidrug effflux MFS transporter [Mucilaginibacter gracilis]RKR84960.1 DHA1 family bicyclomycin/chloramphenicol resistance-like MFS transporter [Mucilaginibacter gracilis]